MDLLGIEARLHGEARRDHELPRDPDRRIPLTERRDHRVPRVLDENEHVGREAVDLLDERRNLSDLGVDVVAHHPDRRRAGDRPRGPRKHEPHEHEEQGDGGPEQDPDAAPRTRDPQGEGKQRQRQREADARQVERDRRDPPALADKAEGRDGGEERRRVEPGKEDGRPSREGRPCALSGSRPRHSPAARAVCPRDRKGHGGGSIQCGASRRSGSRTRREGAAEGGEAVRRGGAAEGGG